MISRESTQLQGGTSKRQQKELSPGSAVLQVAYRFMYKLYRHKLYREQIVSAQIVSAQFVSAQTVSDTNCIGHKWYRAQMVSGNKLYRGTNCIGHKLYRGTNCIGAQIETTNFILFYTDNWWPYIETTNRNCIFIHLLRMCWNCSPCSEGNLRCAFCPNPCRGPACPCPGGP